MGKKPHPQSEPIAGPDRILKSKKKPGICPDYQSLQKTIILSNGRFYRSLKAG
jgi:hypothetical protein